MMRIASILLAAGLAPLWAQDIKLPASLDKLSAKAEESVDITLDGSLLKMAARFLSDKDDPDVAKVKRLLAKLEGVYVRSYQFAEDGDYEPGGCRVGSLSSFNRQPGDASSE